MVVRYDKRRYRIEPMFGRRKGFLSSIVPIDRRTVGDAFIVLVVTAQSIARLLCAKLTRSGMRPIDGIMDPAGDYPYRGDPKYHNSAIRSNKR